MSGVRRRYLLLFLSVVTFFVLGLTIGAVRIPWPAIVQFAVTGHTGQSSWDRILLIARLPRLLNGLASGAALGVCGVLLQTLFRNPLADPYVLGTVQGARLGVAILLAITGTAGSLLTSSVGLWALAGTPAAAAFGSLLVTLILIVAARRLERAALLVFGLMLGIGCLALVDAALHIAGDSQSAVFHFWDHGGFSGATWQQLAIMLPTVAVGIALAVTQIKSLNALMLGEGYAASLGVPVLRARIVAFSAAAILAGVVTAYSGPVAFLGLIVTQFSRALMNTTDHRRLIPASLLLGAALALAADFIVHLPWDGEPPHLDMMMGLLGAPVVIWFLYSRKHRFAQQF